MGRQILFCLLFSGLLCLAGLSGCKGPTAENIPPPMQDSIAIDIPPSVFQVPVTMTTSSLEDYLNQLIQGQFLETTVAVGKKGKEQVKVVMRRIRPIQIGQDGQELVCRFTLEVEATLVQARLNVLQKVLKPVVTDVMLDLRTPVDLDSRWHLVTRFRLHELRWLKPPIVTIAGVDIDLKDKLAKTIEEQKGKLTALMDREINKSVSLDKAVGKVWFDLQKPIRIHKQPPEAYLKFICERIAGRFRLEPGLLVCDATINTLVMVVADTNKVQMRKPLPPFQKAKNWQPQSDVHVYGIMSFEQVKQVLRESLVGKTFTEKGLSGSIEDIDLYGVDSGIVVQVTLGGDVGAKLMATAIPEFDPEQQQMNIRDFDFAVASNSTLVNTSDALLHDRIRDSIQAKLAFHLDSTISKLPGIIDEAIDKGKTGKTIAVHINDMTIASCKFRFGAKRIHVLANTRFEADIRLKQIKAKKKLNIKGKKGAKPPSNP